MDAADINRLQPQAPAAARHLAELVGRYENYLDLRRAISDAEDDARQRFAIDDTNLAATLRPGLSAGYAMAVEAKRAARRRALEGELEAIGRRAATIEAEGQGLRVVTRIAEALRAGRGKRNFIDARPPILTPAEQNDPVRHLAVVRGVISQKVAELEAVDLAPRTGDELIRASHKSIDAFADSGMPSLRLTRPWDGEREYDPDPLRLPKALGIAGGGGTDAIARFMVWVCRDELKRKATALINGADLSGALSDTQRKAELNRLKAELLALERREEALIRCAEQKGQRIPRRPDASLLAVLMVEEVR